MSRYHHDNQHDHRHQHHHNDHHRLSSAQSSKCHAIIHGASAASSAVGFGLAQLPLSDNAVIVPIQTGMAVALADVFGIGLTRSAAEAAVATAAATMAGRTISQVLVGWIPGIGNIINGSTAAAVTEVIGWLLVKQFSRETRFV